MESFPQGAEEKANDSRVPYFGKSGKSIGFFIWAALLIVIPGVVTDLPGLTVLFLCSTSPAGREFDPGYEPKPKQGGQQRRFFNPARAPKSSVSLAFSGRLLLSFDNIYA
jgi:hypothetical protein